MSARKPIAENARQEISKTVAHLLIDTDLKKSDLAPVLRKSPDYVNRKISEGRWVLEDLQLLAEFFGLEPGDFVLGYRHIVMKENHE